VARQLTLLAAELSAAFAVDDTVQHAMGAAGKSAALDAVSADLGADRAFSGFGRIVPLNAGYDLGTPVVVNLRPEGLWILAESGRRRTGAIYPKARRRRGSRKARGRAAVGANGRFVAVGRYRPSRGLNTISDAVRLMDERVPPAIADAVVSKIGGT
jgi:hypothetical protein